MVIEWLPAGAKRIEYLQSTGTQWIDIGDYTLNGYMEVRIDYIPTEVPSGDQDIFGRVSPYTLIGGWNQKIYYQHAQGVDYTIAITAGTRYNLKVINSSSSGKFFVNDTEYTCTRTGIETSDHYGIFAAWNSGNPNYISKSKLYSLILITGSYQKVREFVPIRIGQTGYLYDKVSKQTFGNAGSGNFVLGPDL